MNTQPAPFTIQLRADVLKAISLFQSTDETRFALNGVCIEVHSIDEQYADVVYVATDGRVIGVYRDQNVEFRGAAGTRFRFTFNYAAVLRYFGAKIKEGLLCEVTSPDTVAAPNTISASLKFHPLSGSPSLSELSANHQFTNWRGIFSDSPETVHNGGMAPHFLKKFVDAARILAGKKSTALRIVGHTHADGTAAGFHVFLSDANFAGVLMPMINPERTSNRLPDFITALPSPFVPAASEPAKQATAAA